jgi:hypothetical protein
MEKSKDNKQGNADKQSVTEGRDTGLGRDPKREKLPVEDELEILKSQKGKKVDGDPYDNEKDRPAN